MKESPYGKAEIGRVRPGPGHVDAHVVDPRREGQLAGRAAGSYQGVPPIKAAPWPYRYVPVYFWVGGIAAGSWVAAAAEDLVGAGDRGVIRAARYVALGGVAAGTVLLVLDLGRVERFHHMLRVFRARSPMSLGAWALGPFGSLAGAAAALQLAEDGLGRRLPGLRRISAGWPGRAIHVAGLPFALFIGTYTGVLLTATATPSWARARNRLAPLFLASSLSTGLAAVAAAAELGRGASTAAKRRLARAEVVMLAAELGFMAAERAAVRDLPSVRDAPAWLRVARGAAALGGVAAPIAMQLARLWRRGAARLVTRPGGGPLAELGLRFAGNGPPRLAVAGAPRPDALPAGWGRKGTTLLPARRSARGRAGADSAGAGRKAAGSVSWGGLFAAGLVLVGGLALRALTHHEGRRSAGTPADTWARAAGRRRSAPVAAGAARET